MNSDKDFQDPLKDYAPRSYNDPLESALADETVASIPPESFVAVSPDCTIAAAIDTLLTDGKECLLVVKGRRLAGIWTLWDVLHSVAERYDELAERPLSELMRTEPAFVRESDSVATALAVVTLYGYRHIPVLDDQDVVVGLVSPPRILEFLHARAGS